MKSFLHYLFHYYQFAYNVQRYVPYSFEVCDQVWLDRVCPIDTYTTYRPLRKLGAR